MPIQLSVQLQMYCSNTGRAIQLVTIHMRDFIMAYYTPLCTKQPRASGVVHNVHVDTITWLLHNTTRHTQ